MTTEGMKIALLVIPPFLLSLLNTWRSRHYPTRDVLFSEAMQEREVSAKEMRARSDSRRVDGRNRHDAEKNRIAWAYFEAKHGRRR